MTVFALVNSGAGGSGAFETYNGNTSGSYGIASGKTSQIGAYGSNSGSYFGKVERKKEKNYALSIRLLKNGMLQY